MKVPVSQMKSRLMCIVEVHGVCIMHHDMFQGHDMHASTLIASAHSNKTCILTLCMSQIFSQDALSWAPREPNPPMNFTK